MMHAERNKNWVHDTPNIIMIYYDLLTYWIFPIFRILTRLMTMDVYESYNDLYCQEHMAK